MNVNPLPSRTIRLNPAEARTQAVLRYIVEWWQEPGRTCGPSVRDIQMCCGISSCSVAEYHLNRLEERGLISRVEGMARSIFPTRLKLPLSESVLVVVAGRQVWLDYAECEACGQKLPVGSFAQNQITLELASKCDGCATNG